MSAHAKSPHPMMVEEFYAWNPDDPALYQLVDGEPVAMAPPTLTHGILQSALVRLIGNHLAATGRNCDVITNAGVIPHFMSDHNMRVHDVAVTCEPVTPGQRTSAEPVLLVEILSPSNRVETWANVRAYTSIPSVQDILVVHSLRIAAELLRRQPDGLWPNRPVTVLAGAVELASVGFRLDLAELYARTGLAG